MSLVTTFAQQTAPSNGVPVPVLSPSAWTYGNWAEVITSTATPITITSVVFSSSSLGSGWNLEVQIAVGGSGSEVVISTYLFYFYDLTGGPQVNALDIPLDGITTATRVAVRIRSQTSSSTGISIALNYYSNFDSTHKSTLAAGYIPSGAVGVSITSNAAQWANSNWVPLTTGLSGENCILGLSGNIVGSGAEIELGLGAMGAEVPISVMRAYKSTAGWYDHPLPAPYPVAASTRIAARVRNSNGGAVARTYSLRFLGPTSLLPVPDPTGDGTVPTGTDPATGTTLCGQVAPMTLWAELELDSGTGYYSSVAQPLNHPSTYHGGPKVPRILTLAPVTRALSDWTGHIVTGGTNLLLEDTDKVIRGLSVTNTLINKRVDIYMIDDASARTSGVPYRVGSFLVSDYEPIGDLSFNLTLIDRIGAFGTAALFTKMLPTLLLDTVSFPALPTALIGKPAPIPYGILSDESTGAPVGVVPVFYVGPRVMADGNTWYEGLIAGCATKGPVSVFGSDGGAPQRVKFDTSYYNTDIAFPGQGQWTTVTGTGSNFVVHNGQRYTTMYFKIGSVIGEAMKNGTVPVVVNMGGVEDVGDGTGNVITSLFRQCEHLLINFVLQSPPTNANWLGIPSIGSPSYSIVSTNTFETVKTTSEARVSGGYKGAFIVGWDMNQVATADMLSQIMTSGDFNVYINRHGQICASMEDNGLATVKSFSAITDVAQGSYHTKKDFSKWANHLIWDTMKRYPPSAGTQFLYDTTEWLFAKDVNNDASEETAQRTVQVYSYEDWCTRDFTLTIPNDSATHKLTRMKRGPDFTTFDVDLCGTDLELGNTYNITHFAGVVATVRKCRLYSMSLDAMAGRVTLVGHDMADL